LQPTTPVTITMSAMATRNHTIKTVDQKWHFGYTSYTVNTQPRRAYEKVRTCNRNSGNAFSICIGLCSARLS